jgi:hypothetical protein
MEEAVNTSEMVVNFYQTTWRIIPADSHLNAIALMKEAVSTS